MTVPGTTWLANPRSSSQNSAYFGVTVNGADSVQITMRKIHSQPRLIQPPFLSIHRTSPLIANVKGPLFTPPNSSHVYFCGSN